MTFWFLSKHYLPPMATAILVLTVQRYIVRGLTFGAVKG